MSHCVPVFLALVLWGLPLVCSAPTTAHPDARDLTDSPGYSYVFEVMAVTILVLLGTNCWLWLSRPSPKNNITVECKVSSDAGATSIVHDISDKAKNLSDLAPDEVPRPEYWIYFTQHGKCWHLNKTCYQLKKATTKVTSLAPCQTCAASFHLWRMHRL